MSTFYTVSNTDPKTMTAAAIAVEVDDLKSELVKIETQIAEKKAWAVADRTPEVELAGWLAKTRHFRKMLLCRYMLIRPLYRVNNRALKH